MCDEAGANIQGLKEVFGPDFVLLHANGISTSVPGDNYDTLMRVIGRHS